MYQLWHLTISRKTGIEEDITLSIFSFYICFEEDEKTRVCLAITKEDFSHSRLGLNPIIHLFRSLQGSSLPTRGSCHLPSLPEDPQHSPDSTFFFLLSSIPCENPLLEHTRSKVIFEHPKRHTLVSA